MRNGLLARLAGRRLGISRFANALWAGGAIALFISVGAGSPRPALAADPLEVVKLVLSEREVSAGGQQILQVTMRGLGSRPTRAGLRVDIRDERDNRVGPGIDRVVQVGAGGEQREFFRFDAPNRFGRFTVRVEVFAPDFKSRLLAGAPVFYAPFQVGSIPEPGLAAKPRPGEKPEPGRPAMKAGPPTFAPPRGLSFEKPDLVWENVDIQPMALLVGEPLTIKADLRNVGGDIARGIDIKADYFNTRTPANLISISKSTVPVLAPGDKVAMEFEAKFPEDSPLGDYKVQLVIDPANRVAETNKENNVVVSEVPIRLSLIKLVFPEPGYYFEQTGLFLFRWDSRRFDEFKVQVGTDPAFTTADTYFDIPQGDKWTKDREIVPLEGELPDMALGLMEKGRTNQLYWRVVGRSTALGVQSVSQSSVFSIRKMAGKPGEGSMEPAAKAPARPPAAQKDRVEAPKNVEPPAKPSDEAKPREVAPKP